jgi:hypothetical protein
LEVTTVLQRSHLLTLLLGLAIPSLSVQAQAPLPKKIETPAASPEQQIYQATKKMLELFEQDLLEKKKRISGALVGRETGILGSDPWKVTEKEVAAKFQGPIDGVRKQLVVLEAEHKQVLLGKDAPCTVCAHEYFAVAGPALESFWSADPEWFGLSARTLQQSFGNAETQFENARTRNDDVLGNTPNLTPEALEAARAAFGRKESEGREKVFNDIAREYRGYVQLLNDDRKKIVEQLWCWHDLVGRLSTNKEDEFAETARTIENETLHSWDTEDGRLALGYGDEVVMQYEDYDWCKKRPYKDIQDESCHVLRADLMRLPSVASLHPKNCPDAVPAKQLQYRVASLKIDYVRWESRNESFRDAVNQTDRALKAAQAAQATLRKELDHEEVNDQGRDYDLNVFRKRRDQAIADAQKDSPEEAKKTPEYKKVEADLNAAKVEKEAVFAKIDALPAPPLTKPAVMDPLLKRYDQLDGSEKQLTQQLKALQDQTGFTASHARARQYAKELDDQYYAKLKRNLRLKVDLDGKRLSEQYAQKRVDEAQEAFSRAFQDLTKFRAQESPRISAIRVFPTNATSDMYQANPYYAAEIWSPTDFLTLFDQGIPKLKEAMDTADYERKMARQLMMRDGDASIQAGEHLWWMIMGSGGAQMLTELGFFAWDSAKSAKEAGLFGVLYEACKKAAENYLFTGEVGWKLESAGVAFDDWDYYVGMLEKKGVERDAKTLITGPLAGTLNAYMVDSHSTSEFLKAWNRETARHEYFLMGTSVDAGGESLEAELARKLAKMNKAAAKYHEQIADSALSGFSKMSAEVVHKVSKKFLEGLAKDFAKQSLKKGLADLFEGEAMRDYARANMNSAMSTRLLMAWSGIYWEAADKYEAAIKLREDLLRQYDEARNTRTLASRTFDSGQDLYIEVRPVSPYRRHELDVRLGGVSAASASPRSPDTMLFKVKADNLQHDEKGGVVLTIDVSQ